MAYKIRTLLLVLVMLLLAGAFGGLSFHHFMLRGMQAEAKLMMSYLHTLQRVHRLEQGRNATWNEFYGASIDGADNCVQPEEAAKVGFLIAGCHRESGAIPRYAYRVLPMPNEGYRIEAIAGSDKRGFSVVCFDEHGRETWQSEQNHGISQVVTCW